MVRGTRPSSGERAASRSVSNRPEAGSLRSSVLKLLAAGAVLGALIGAYVLGTQTARDQTPARRTAKSEEPAATAPRLVLKLDPTQREEEADAHAQIPSEPAPDPETGDHPHGLSAVEHRDRVLAGLRASGRDQRLTTPGRTVVRGWTEKLQKLGVAGKFEPLECYAKGCAVTIVHPSQSAADEGTEVVTRTGEFHGWRSGKMRSGLIPKDGGQVEITWILESPPDDGPVLPDELPQDNFDELKHLLARGSH